MLPVGNLLLSHSNCRVSVIWTHLWCRQLYAASEWKLAEQTSFLLKIGKFLKYHNHPEQHIHSPPNRWLSFPELTHPHIGQHYIWNLDAPVTTFWWFLRIVGTCFVSAPQKRLDRWFIKIPVLPIIWSADLPVVIHTFIFGTVLCTGISVNAVSRYGYTE